MPPPKPRDHAPIHLWHPTIHTTPITTIPHLHKILEIEFPGLHRSPNYSQLLKDQTHLQRGDRKRIGKELGITRQNSPPGPKMPANPAYTMNWNACSRRPKPISKSVNSTKKTTVFLYR